MLNILSGKKKTLVFVFAFMLVTALISTPAFAADWGRFQYDNSNSGVIQSSESPPMTSSPNLRTVELGAQSSMYAIDIPPLVVNESGTYYAYVINTVNNASRLFKIKCSDGTQPTGWSGGLNIDSNAGFQLATPVINGTDMYVGVSDQAQKITNSTFDSDDSGWTKSYDSGSPTISYDSTNKCEKIERNRASTFTGGIYQNSIVVNSTDKVRATMRYRMEGTYTSATFKVRVSTDNGSNWTDIYTDNTYSGSNWVDMNADYTDLFGSNATYRVKYEVSVTGAAAGAYALLDNCGFICENTYVKKVSGITGSSPSVSTIFNVNDRGGQMNSPLLYDNGYIYTGSYKGGSTVKGSYYKVNVSNGNVTTYTPADNGDGFYWAGAASIGNYIVMGSDKSIIRVLKKSDMSLVDSYNISGTGAGHESTAGYIRSAICYRDVSGTTSDKIYFTDRGSTGYLWCLNIDSSTGALSHAWHTAIGYSTSTPVYYDGKVYVGVGGVSNSVAGKLYCLDANDGSAEWNIGGNSYYTTTTFGGVQASPIVYHNSSDGYNYIYFTTNGTNGKGYCIKDQGTTASNVWTLPTGTSPTGSYTLQGMGACGDYVVWGNDLGNVYIAY